MEPSPTNLGMGIPMVYSESENNAFFKRGTFRFDFLGLGLGFRVTRVSRSFFTFRVSGYKGLPKFFHFEGLVFMAPTPPFSV
jgi:hypothetical protein